MLGTLRCTMVLSLKGCGGRGETPRCPRPKRELEEERFYDAFTRRSRAPASARRVSLTSYELYCISRQCREIDDGTKAGASVKACRFVARRSPRGHMGSVLDVRKRLHRVRHPFHQSIHIKQGAWQCADLSNDPPKFWIQSPLGSSKRRRMRDRRLLTTRPTPRDLQ